MKSLLTKGTSLLAILFAIGALILTSCEGPAGPAGANGADGKDGSDGVASCGKCHNGNAEKINTIFSQYDLSKHNKGIVYEEEAGRIACGGCHSGDGFAEAAGKGVDDPTVHATSKINCSACHFVHTKFDSTDFNLRISSGFALRHTAAPIDMKTGNICAKCHQARKFTRTVPDTVSPASSTVTYSRFGPHYGTPANVITMNGLYKIAGSTAYPSENPHGNLPKGCVSCHMGADATNPAVGGHSFLMPVANLANRTDCYTCHDKTTLTARANYKDMTTKLATYRRLLIDKGFLDTTQAVTAEGYQILGEYFKTPGGNKKVVYTNPTDVEVVLNYLYVAKDRSFGVHNPKFVKAIVENGIEYLSK